jgi:hypothetical protein
LIPKVTASAKTIGDVLIVIPFLYGAERSHRTSGFRRVPLAARRAASRCSMARALELHCRKRLQTAKTGYSSGSVS